MYAKSRSHTKFHRFLFAEFKLTKCASDNLDQYRFHYIAEICKYIQPFIVVGSSSRSAQTRFNDEPIIRSHYSK